MSLLIQTLVALAVAVLRYVQSREDLKQTAFDKVSAEDAQYAIQALQWKASAVTTPDGGAGLGVRDPANRIELQGSGPEAGGPPAGGSV